jgi:Icc-related predicted phosphoesterase
MNKNDPNTLWHVGRMMNDFRTVRNGDKGKLNPTDVYEEHLSTLEYIRSVVDKDPMQKYVVVGHHAPSKQSIKPHYRGDHLVNGAYSSDLSEFILDRPQIKLWTHGHTHDNFDYMVGTTRVLCNPRGYYKYEENDNFDPNMVVELE